MARYIDLFDGSQSLGSFDLPERVTGVDGQVFQLNRVIRGGGNGIVFEAFELGHPNDVCAVKFLRQQDKQRVDRFLNEVRIMRDLDHEYIAQLYDSGTVAVGDGAMKVHWAAMTLGKQNLRYAPGQPPIPIQAVAHIGIQMCRAINHLHEKQIIHRDIKPENFVWSEGLRVMMIDFGIAKYIGEDFSGRPLEEFTRHMEFVGPVFFSSSELIAYANNKLHPVTHLSDLFQLGKLLWYLGTGKVSAGIPSPRECPAGGRLRELVVDLIYDDPASRLQSAVEVEARLRTLNA